MFVDILFGVACGIPIGRLICRYQKRVIILSLVLFLSVVSSVALYELLPPRSLLTGLYPLWSAFAALVTVHSREHITWRKYVLIVGSVSLIGLLYLLLNLVSENGWDKYKDVCVPLSIGYVVGGAMSVYRVRNCLRIAVVGGVLVVSAALVWSSKVEIAPMVCGVAVGIASKVGWSCALRYRKREALLKEIFNISAVAAIIIVR